MSERIEVGDLVMIVRGHECIMKLYQGVIFTVTGLIMPRSGGWHCDRCGKDNAAGNEMAATGFRKRGVMKRGPGRYSPTGERNHAQ